jgi:hypothetical protein
MLRSRVLSLPAVIFGLTLPSATAFAHDHDRDWNRRYWHDADRNWRNHYREHRRYDPYYSYHRSGWRDRCIDPDHDGDCDFIRHRHRRYYHNGWYGNNWYGNRHYSHRDNGGNYPYAAGWNSVWQNGRWGNGNAPPGWRRGGKRGWGDSNLPPGLTEKSWWW